MGGERLSSGNFPDTNFRSWVSSHCDVNHNGNGTIDIVDLTLLIEMLTE